MYGNAGVLGNFRLSGWRGLRLESRAERDHAGSVSA